MLHSFKVSKAAVYFQVDFPPPDMVKLRELLNMCQPRKMKELNRNIRK
jgi:hypothetical protein